jgi:hypothetical protein
MASDLTDFSLQPLTLLYKQFTCRISLPKVEILPVKLMSENVFIRREVVSTCPPATTPHSATLQEVQCSSEVRW